MWSSLPYRAAFTGYRSFLLKKFKLSHQLLVRLPNKSSNIPFVESFNTRCVTTQSSLLIKYTFVKMECCGNSCGPDFSKESLKQRLTSQQYQVTQEKDTERAFTGKYYKHFERGTYTCIVCNQDLFSSESKYDSKCGWPAFYDIINSSCVTLKNDLSHNMKRTEVCCSKCGAHLGHVFDDGPKPTGKRYCINSAALNFRKSEEATMSDSTSSKS